MPIFNLYLGQPQGSAHIYLQNAALFWMPLVALAAFGAFRYMNNLTSARSNFRDQLVITRNKHTWVMSWLYIGTFGSFIGYSAAFPLLLKTQYPQLTTNLAFLGALVGSLARPLGGKLADRIGGARVTLWNFVAMAAGDARRDLLRPRSFFPRIPDDVPGAVRDDRRRQRFHLPHDPRHLSTREAARRPGAAARRRSTARWKLRGERALPSSASPPRSALAAAT